MAAIPGWAYLIIGAGMSIMSKYVEKKSPASKFTLFFYVGIIFIIIGVFKIIIKSVFKKEKNQVQPPHHRAHRQNTAKNMNVNPYLQNQQPINPQNNQMQHMQGQHHISNATQNQIARQESTIIPCQSCGTKHYSYANYCMLCGSKLNKR
jgi:hypothetical protein